MAADLPPASVPVPWSVAVGWEMPTLLAQKWENLASPSFAVSRRLGPAAITVRSRVRYGTELELGLCHGGTWEVCAGGTVGFGIEWPRYYQTDDNQSGGPYSGAFARTRYHIPERPWSVWWQADLYGGSDGGRVEYELRVGTVSTGFARHWGEG